MVRIWTAVPRERFQVVLMSSMMIFQVLLPRHMLVPKTWGDVDDRLTSVVFFYRLEPLVGALNYDFIRLASRLLQIKYGRQIILFQCANCGDKKFYLRGNFFLRPKEVVWPANDASLSRPLPVGLKCLVNTMLMFVWMVWISCSDEGKINPMNGQRVMVSRAVSAPRNLP